MANRVVGAEVIGAERRLRTLHADTHRRASPRVIGLSVLLSIVLLGFDRICR